MYMTALGVLCCFALFICLTLLASFFLPSHLSFKNIYIYMFVTVAYIRVPYLRCLQVVLTVSQIMWCRDLTECLTATEGSVLEEVKEAEQRCIQVRMYKQTTAVMARMAISIQSSTPQAYVYLSFVLCFHFSLVLTLSLSAEPQQAGGAGARGDAQAESQCHRGTHHH